MWFAQRDQAHHCQCSPTMEFSSVLFCLFGSFKGFMSHNLLIIALILILVNSHKGGKLFRASHAHIAN